MSQGGPIDIYLCAGQSNMRGYGDRDTLPGVLNAPHDKALIFHEATGAWEPLQPGLPGGDIEDEDRFGPELSFGHTLAAGADHPVGLVKVAVGGTDTVHDWNPDAVNGQQLFSRAVQTTQAAMQAMREQGLEPTLKGLFWYQGESDASPETAAHIEQYPQRLAGLMQRFREALGFLPVVLVRVKSQPELAPNIDAVRDAQVAWAESDACAAWVTVDDASDWVDEWHIGNQGLMTCGDRAAEAIVQLPEQAERAEIAEPVDDVEEVDELGEAVPEPGPTPETQPAAPGQRRLIALINQKGGVGKTTTTTNLGAALAAAGLKVLLIDLDPQAHLTLSVGVNPDELEHSMYDLLADDAVGAMQVVQRLNDNLAILPAEVSLAGVEAELADRVITGTAQTVLRSKCAALVEQFDYVLLDCPPSLGLLTINALSMAEEVIVPMQAHFLALQGLGKLLETVGMLRQGINPSLTVAGVVLCMHEGNTLLAGEVVNEVRGFLEEARGTDLPWAGAQVYDPPVRRNIKLAEAPSFGQTIFEYAPDSHGAKDYAALAKGVAGLS